MGKIIGQDNNKKVLKLAIKKDMPVLLVGETGTGKTSIVRELAKEQKKKLIRLNLNGQTSTDEFVGHWLVKNGATYWQDGVLVRAMKEGSWIVLDEINACLPEILFVLQSLLDDDKSIILSENNAEIIKPAKGFRLFATMNPSDEYAGTKELNKAFVSRFPLILEFNYPDQETEEKILVDATGVDSDTATKLIQFFNILRKLKVNEDIFYTPSTRDVIYWATLIAEGFSIKDAFEYSIIHRATNGDKDIIRKEFEKFFGEIFELEKEFGTDINNILEQIKQEKQAQLERKEALEQASKLLQEQREKIKEELEKRREEIEKALNNKENTKSKEKKESKKKEKKSEMRSMSRDYMIDMLEKVNMPGVPQEENDGSGSGDQEEQKIEPKKEVEPTSQTCSHQCDSCPSKATCLNDTKGIK